MAYFQEEGGFNDLFFPEGRGRFKGKKPFFRGPEVWMLIFREQKVGK